MAEALSLPDAHFTAFREDMRAKGDLLAAGLAEAGFGVFRPAGTYFVTADIRLLGERDGFAFRRALPTHHAARRRSPAATHPRHRPPAPVVTAPRRVRRIRTRPGAPCSRRPASGCTVPV